MSNKVYYENFIGEFVGIFILVFFGCGAVAVSTLFSAQLGIFHVAAIFGIGVTLGIYASRYLSCAHLNPAVSIAMVVSGRMSLKKLPVYFLAQFLGAFLAAACLYALFSNSISAFEHGAGITRGAPESIVTAMMFGEYFPNPGLGQQVIISHLGAAFAEGIGAFLLVIMIFLFTESCNVGRPESSFAPILIGAVVTAIIVVIAPLTQAGLNPARDFGPRLFSYFAGWHNIAIPGPMHGFFTVYILSPIIGGVYAALFFSRVIEPLMKKKNTCCPIGSR
jgi:glycerol uptake facilitator protein